jgi:hypothetical protein
VVAFPTCSAIKSMPSPQPNPPQRPPRLNACQATSSAQFSGPGDTAVPLSRPPMFVVEFSASSACWYCHLYLSTSVTDEARLATPASGPLLLSAAAVGALQAGFESYCWRFPATQVPQQDPAQCCTCNHKSGPSPSCSQSMAALNTSTVSASLSTPIREHHL